jgi:16S rRNA (cytosine967-C5)-methyltransferase
LVYVTCSVLAAENEQVVERFLAEADGYRLLPVTEVWHAVIGGECPAAAGTLRLNARDHGTDGFYIAVFERTG